MTIGVTGRKGCTVWMVEHGREGRARDATDRGVRGAQATALLHRLRHRGLRRPDWLLLASGLARQLVCGSAPPLDQRNPRPLPSIRLPAFLAALGLYWAERAGWVEVPMSNRGLERIGPRGPPASAECPIDSTPSVPIYAGWAIRTKYDSPSFAFRLRPVPTESLPRLRGQEPRPAPAGFTFGSHRARSPPQASVEPLPASRLDREEERWTRDASSGPV
jgi:hypothetical protein